VRCAWARTLGLLALRKDDDSGIGGARAARVGFARRPDRGGRGALEGGARGRRSRRPARPRARARRGPARRRPAFGGLDVRGRSPACATRSRPRLRPRRPRPGRHRPRP
jgi:hypothetical protein